MDKVMIATKSQNTTSKIINGNKKVLDDLKKYKNVENDYFRNKNTAEEIITKTHFKELK